MGIFLAEEVNTEVIFELEDADWQHEPEWITDLDDLRWAAEEWMQSAVGFEKYYGDY